MASKKYYAVLKGRKTGIFTNWADCEEQINGFGGALYKSFKTRGEAEAALGLTTAFGEAYIAALGMLFVNSNGEPPTPEEVAEAFKKKYSQLAIVK